MSVIDNNKPKVVFVGDTSLRTSHFGCQLVGQTFREQFSRVGLELTASLPTKFEQVSNWKKYLKEASLVVINGEGSIHHGRFQNLIDLSDKYPCVLVNCVYQENPFNEHLKGFKYISTRESLSLQELKKNDVTAEVVPDVLFASTFLRSFVPTSKVVHDVGYTDCSQKEQWSFGPFSFRYRPGFSPKTSIVADYLNYLCSHKKIAIGRFHAAVCCSVLGIPFSTWDSNTWKIKGLMSDMGIPQLHFDSRKEAMENVPDEIPENVREFSDNAKRRVESMFDRLSRIARV